MFLTGAGYGGHSPASSFRHEGLSRWLPAAGEKHLCCYGRKKSAPFLTASENLANRHDYYSLKAPDGMIDYSLETPIGTEIESPGNPVIQKHQCFHITKERSLAPSPPHACEGSKGPVRHDHVKKELETLLNHECISCPWFRKSISSFI